MSDAFLLLPDFLLIAIGFIICRTTSLGRPIWDGVERLVYYVLFPALLFGSILRQPLHAGALAPMAFCGVAVVVIGIALALWIGRWPGIDRTAHASGAQTAFRFNSYIGLALADRLGGAESVAWVALLIALCVPLCNIAAVWPLARHGGQHYGRELLRNPLILATGSGLIANMLGVQLPELASLTLQRMGGAAVTLGLMSVGAGLKMGALRDQPRLAAAFMGIRHLLLPAIAIVLVLLAGLPPGQQAAVVAFAALPTASSAYVLAARMGGNGPYVAGLVSLSTLLGMFLLPMALMALRAVT